MRRLKFYCQKEEPRKKLEQVKAEKVCQRKCCPFLLKVTVK